MPEYRLLILNEKAKVVVFDAFEADDDQLAWQHAQQWFSAAYAVEVWCDTRKLDEPEYRSRRRQACG